VRSQLSENEIEKQQLKKKCEERVRAVDQQYQELLVEYRKNKLEKKIFENKLEELEE
jgi:allophanate hydrolase subunit 1